ncbi:MAG: type II toxin-antitoxin system RelE/ParE family toxin [Pacificimonas sp.]|nr:type II toxin-antitoxin system RelE/ParE family toxin [Pacificimonas sp.]
MIVEFAPAAQRDLTNIQSWIAVDSTAAADRTVGRLFQAALTLGDFPRMGPEVATYGARSFSVPGLNYRLIYSVDDDAEVVVILAVLHTRQLYSGK